MRIDFLILLITAIVAMVPANAQDSNISNQNWRDSVSKYLGDNGNEQFVIYGDPARKIWNEITQQNFLFEYENRFYGKDIGTMVKNDAGNDLFYCSTSDPTLFWELLLIRPEGDSIKCKSPPS